MAGQRRFPTLLLLTALGVSAVVGTAVWWGLFGGPAPLQLTEGEATELIHVKNVALGQLENQRNQEAIDALEPLLKRLARDPLPARNIAAARAVSLGESIDKAPPVALTPEMFATARQALSTLQRVEGESVAFHWLALHVAMMESNREEAEHEIDAILKLTPDDPTAWYARYQVYNLGFPKTIDPKAIEAIDTAARLNPANAWYRIEWLNAMHNHLNEQPPPKIDPKYFGEQLESLRKTLAPFAHLIKVLTREDVNKLIDDAKGAAESGDWDGAGFKLLLIKNISVQHANPDIAEAQRHPLEFILNDFQPQFYTAAHLSQQVEAPPIAVKFEPLPWESAEPGSGEPPSAAVDLALADFNLDGFLDILALGPKSIVVWSRKGPSEPWSPIAQAEVEGFDHLLAQDLDADFDEVRAALSQLSDHSEPESVSSRSASLKNVCPTADVDIVLFGAAGVLLLENRYDAKTKERSLVAVAADKLPGSLSRVTAAAATDLEADGDLDLVLAGGDGVKMWSCVGGWRFVDITERSTTPDPSLQITQLLPLDWDRDVDIDVLVAAPQGAGYLENTRHGQFRWRAFDGEVAALAQARALEAIDADANAAWDVVGAVADGVVLATTTNPQSGVVRSQGNAVVSKTAATGLLAWDYDNDGYDDLLAWGAGGVEVLRGGAKLAKGDAQIDAGPTRLSLAGDLDNDGDLDVVTLGENGSKLWTNAGGNANHWVDVALQAQQNQSGELAASGRVSPYGNGSLLELKSGQIYQAKVVRGQVTHFGIGQAEQADVIRVVWINGVPQNIIKPAADTFVCEQQLLLGSCPYLYAWDGKGFVFCTDLLWNAPLGLQYAENVIAKPREWEYLKVSGKQLREQDGRYRLQLTEELWEAAYFDQVKLIAVDHPQEVEVYSNEKVGPAELATYKIHTVRQSRAPLAAKNHNGRDLLQDLASQDGVYAAVHDMKLRQGVVEDSYLELDLGDVSGAKQLTLFLTGWIYPSGTSINVALSQGGPLPPGKPPALSVPDGKGGWKEVLPFMGFPGGKTKTIAVDLTGVLTPGDGRLRISTSMEFYWDHVFFTVDDAPAEVRTHELELLSADLHYRGFSRIEHDRHKGPEHFLYDDVSQAAKWPPMVGAFTNYGDVRPLLRERDEQMVVMGAGDEVSLEFAAPEPPPAGWSRDFLIYNVGYDKDANLLTALGETTDLAPLNPVTLDPPPAAVKASRTQSPAFWKTILRW